jgi:hypothetical protein
LEGRGKFSAELLRDGRNYMKFRLGLLLCGIVLIAAAPVWADKAPGDSGKEFGSRETSQKMGSSSFGTSTTFDTHAGGSSDADSFGVGAGARSNWVAATEREGLVEGVPTTPPAMPEPASLPLIVFGLVGVGFYARRR